MAKTRQTSNRPGSFWTAERDAEIRKLWSDGFTCSQIAVLVGAVSRNAVIGRVRRLDLPFRSCSTGSGNRRSIADMRLGGKIAKMNRNKHQPRQKGKPFVFSKSHQPLSPERALKRDGLPIPSPADMDIPQVSFHQLNEDGKSHCKWPCLSDVAGVPQDQPMFCGEKPVPGLPYCKPHALRAGMTKQVALALWYAEQDEAVSPRQPSVPRVVEEEVVTV